MVSMCEASSVPHYVDALYWSQLSVILVDFQAALKASTKVPVLRLNHQAHRLGWTSLDVYPEKHRKRQRGRSQRIKKGQFWVNIWKYAKVTLLPTSSLFPQIFVIMEDMSSTTFIFQSQVSRAVCSSSILSKSLNVSIK